MSLPTSATNARPQTVTDLYVKSEGREVKNSTKLLDTLGRYNLRRDEFLIVKTNVGAYAFAQGDDQRFGTTYHRLRAKKATVYEIYIGERRQ